VTGPLAHQFAQVRDGLHMLAKFRDHQRQHGSIWPDGPHVFPQAVEENFAALSVIERHLEDMETALAPFAKAGKRLIHEGSA